LRQATEVSTTRKALHKAGLRYLRRRKKPRLSKQQIRARLAFAQQHAGWTVEDWKRVIWSDETMFNLYEPEGDAYYWGQPGGRLDSRSVREAVKYGSGYIMVWGCMMADGLGLCCRIEGNLNAELYEQILSDELTWSLEYHNREVSDILFQQDNDPKHTSKRATKWFEKHGMEVMDWPPQSPDLSPIEYLWKYIKERLRNDYRGHPTSAEELWRRVKETWDNVDPAYCSSLVESMPERIAAVLKAKGKWTRF